MLRQDGVCAIPRAGKPAHVRENRVALDIRLTSHDLADLGWYIGEHDRLMTHWKAELPNPILTVRLADWVEDFEGTLDMVLTHLDLPTDPNCMRFYEGSSRVRTVSRAQVRQPVNARGLGRWRAYASELAPLIAELEDAGSLEGWRDATP